MVIRKTARLNGRDYEIDSEEVKNLGRRLDPKPIDKYWVKIENRRLPPKQVVAELLSVPLVSFTTMDANRILSAVGFKVYSEGETLESVRTESEVLLEEYLKAHGLTDFDFEPTIPGSTARPDFLLRANGTEVILEVKEFRATADDFRFGGGAYDPYVHIREKIKAARKKFKDLKGRCCCLVLHNQEKPLVSLEWQIVVGAMLGDLGYSFPVDMKTGKGDASQMKRATLGRGEMHKHVGSTPVGVEKTTISAILVVERYRIGEKRFRLFVHEREQELGRDLDFEEYWELLKESEGTDRDLSLSRIRVRVHENPHASAPLARELFNGRFDERFGEVENTGKWGQVFVGRGVAEFEEKSPAAKLLSDS